jgi:Haem-degrading
VERSALTNDMRTSSSHGGAFPIWIRHVTAAPIGVIVVSGLPQEMDHQRASIPALTNNTTNSCDSSGRRRSEGLHSEDRQRRGIKHGIMGVIQSQKLPRFSSCLPNG